MDKQPNLDDRVSFIQTIPTCAQQVLGYVVGLDCEGSADVLLGLSVNIRNSATWANIFHHPRIKYSQFAQKYAYYYWARHDELTVVSAAPIYTKATINTTHSKIVPVDEAALRKILTAPMAGNCPCNLLRSQCTYHK